MRLSPAPVATDRSAASRCQSPVLRRAVLVHLSRADSWALVILFPKPYQIIMRLSGALCVVLLLAASVIGAQAKLKITILVCRDAGGHRSAMCGNWGRTATRVPASALAAAAAGPPVIRSTPSPCDKTGNA